MPEKILCVDDDPNILNAYRRGLRRKFDVETAPGGPEALKMIGASETFAVIVADMRMPGMDGVELLANVKQKSPDTVRVMLTGNADQQTAIDAVNQGSIFRFLTKPCPLETLAMALDAGIQQHRLITAEKQLLRQTLRGSIKVLSDVLSLVNPVAFGHVSRVRNLVKQIAKRMCVVSDWRIDMAAMLANIGCVTVPPDVLDKIYAGRALTPAERDMYGNHPSVAHDLLRNIPRLEEVAQIVAYQEKQFDGGGVPADEKKEHEIPLGSRILKLARDFDVLTWQGLSQDQAMLKLRETKGVYDPEILDALQNTIGFGSTLEMRKVNVRDLAEKMILAEPVVTTTGVTLAPKGTDVSAALKHRLYNFARGTPIQEPIAVFVPNG